jgi:hypothetical protein
MNGWSVGVQLANYDVILAEADAAGIPVWITTTQPRNTTADGRASLIAMKDSTLARWGDMAVDFWTLIANPDGTINPTYDSGDGVHLNDLAHGVLFGRVDEKDVWAAIAGGPVGAPGALPDSAELGLHPASPNPFRDATTLSYTLPSPARVRLGLYDVRGRRVGALEDRDMPAGTHRVALDARALGSGVYFYRLEAGRAAAAGRIVRID